MGEQTNHNHDQEAKIEGIPLTVEESLAILDKWATHPGLLTALFDAGPLAAAEVRRLREAPRLHLHRPGGRLHISAPLF
jgi:hypothetical protein